MLEPADLLLLDEPTNDLDIPTLEVLEESLLEFKGALVLVTHDRYMLDRVSTVVWGLDGAGNAGNFADFSQWEEWQISQKSTTRTQGLSPVAARTQAAIPPARKKLSYLDSRDFETIEERISAAEELLASKKLLLENSDIVRDPKRLSEALRSVEEAQAAVDQLYERWAELEAKIS
jgi:ATP-binding cassette subfamily F protein uup